MRVVIFHSQFTTLGGAEILIATQARWLQAAGHDVRIVALDVDRASIARELPDLRVDAVDLPQPVPRIESMGMSMMPQVIERVNRYLQDCDTVMAFNFPCAPVAAACVIDARKVWYACEPFRALYLTEANPYTFEHVKQSRSAPGPAAAAQLARRLRRRRLSQLVMPWSAQRARALKAFDRDGVQAISAVASLSQYGASCVELSTGRSDASVIPPMVRFSSPPQRARGIQRDAPQILVQTRFAPPKNLDTLLHAFGIVLRKYPRAKLHVVGKGSGQAGLEAIANMEAPGSVVFHGFLPEHELDKLSASCDIFAFVPLDEPFGMVFPEAAARGLLLVGPDHGGPREILEDGAIGEISNPFDARSVADAIHRTLALTDSAADARRTAADISVRARYSPETIGPQLVQFLRG